MHRQLSSLITSRLLDASSRPTVEQHRSLMAQLSESKALLARAARGELQAWQ